MNQEIAPTTENQNLPTSCITNSGKEIFYGLIILIELAEKYYSDGCNLTFISKKHNFPLHDLIPIVSELEKAGLIGCRECDSNWWFLKGDPDNTWIIEVVSTLKYIFNSKK